MWNAHFLGKCIELYEKGENGMAKVLAHIDMPTHNLTCPALGGPDMNWMIVTSAGQQEGQEPNTVGGNLWITKVETAGLPESRFKDI